MASAAYESASPRQKELLRRSAQVLGGFSAENDITSVTYASGTEVPVDISYSTNTGTFTRSVESFYGDLELSEAELFSIRQLRLGAKSSAAASPVTTGVSTTASRRSTAFAATGKTISTTAGSIVGGAVKSAFSKSSLGRSASILSQVAPSLYATIVGRFPSAGSDTRVKISDPSGRISQLGGALEPLSRTDYKVVFPYTPEITINHQANYTDSNPTHSNYEYLFYQHSVVSEINISAMFTARNSQDAEYVLAMQHFFRSATKMFYGNDDIAGLPPIVCRLEGHGDLQFSYVPVVITGFNVTLPSDVDYISAVSTRSNTGRVPTIQTVNITAKPIYSRSRITNEFSLTDFARGGLLGNPRSGRGGFI